MEPLKDGVSLPDDEDLLEDAEVIEELTDSDLYEENPRIVAPPETGFVVEEFDAFSAGKNPIATVTMAELYVSQGFTKRALTIYRELLDADPQNVELKKRLYELKMAIDEDTASARYHGQAGTQTKSERVAMTTAAFGAAVSPSREDRVLETLGKWLDAIKRRR